MGEAECKGDFFVLRGEQIGKREKEAKKRRCTCISKAEGKKATTKDEVLPKMFSPQQTLW